MILSLHLMKVNIFYLEKINFEKIESIPNLDRTRRLY